MFSPLPGSYCAVSPVHRGLIAGLECAEPEAGSVSSTNPSSTAVRWRIRDRKSTRLNSSHLVTSYAAFCLKKRREVRLSAGVAAEDGACADSFGLRGVAVRCEGGGFVDAAGADTVRDVQLRRKRPGD